jgi:hypothetical protein
MGTDGGGRHTRDGHCVSGSATRVIPSVPKRFDDARLLVPYAAGDKIVSETEIGVDDRGGFLF